MTDALFCEVKTSGKSIASHYHHLASLKPNPLYNYIIFTAKIQEQSPLKTTIKLLMYRMLDNFWQIGRFKNRFPFFFLTVYKK
ncbi:MAG: hypothetical protein A2173_05765 [Planctomycetes bacterium RBG_13_44_8b]|nr:MAG: hypothetical protein A2173_05765 [Planctomycetes bacterium RBG_13_44_8b]